MAGEQGGYTRQVTSAFLPSLDAILEYTTV